MDGWMDGRMGGWMVGWACAYMCVHAFSWQPQTSRSTPRAWRWQGSVSGMGPPGREAEMWLLAGCKAARQLHSSGALLASEYFNFLLK